MHPVFLGFLPAFGVLVATGFLVGASLWGRLLRRYGLDPERDQVRASEVSVWLLIGVIGGARLMYVGVEVARYLAAERTPEIKAYLDADDRRIAAATFQGTPEERERAYAITVGYDFLHEPEKILFVWEGGLVMYGGLIGAILLGLWKAKKVGLHRWNGLDTGLAAGFVGQAIGRWGCLLVGDDYGKVVPEKYAHLSFPITIRVPSREWLEANPKSLFEEHLAGEVLWATQPWMSLNALLVALVAYLILRRRRYYGTVTGVVLIQYSVTRGIIELFRGDSVRGVWNAFGITFSTSQLLALLGVAAGAAILVTARKRPVAGMASPALASA